MAKKSQKRAPLQGEDEIQNFVDAGKSDYQIQREQEIAKEKAELDNGFERTTVVSGADFHNFTVHPKFVGVYMGTTVIAEQDSSDRKKGDLMGYHFADYFSGEEVIIGATHAIQKGIEQSGGKKGTIFEIEWKGKKEGSSGRSFNQFSIAVLTPKKK